uniref:Serine--tRNA ligase n=1 Tax=Paraflavisolibacter caeni TaxID=2982496 RepID=A0A9X3BGY3_9BACT|nr:serine--tRNA ligase [Paraflavisolibacter caeni]MCU7548617.1 serine--tRNA ligase [Paraflavisolibacter caeni]
MLQLAVLRNNTELVRERLAVKNFAEISLVDDIISLDDERKKLTFQFDETKAKINATSKEIGMLMGKGQKEEAETKKKDVENLKNNLSPIQQQLDSVEKQLNDLLVRLPNLPSEKVPLGKTPADNEMVRTGGSKPELPPQAVPHWDLAKKLDLIDFELGNKITGSGFPVYKNKGAKLQRALIQYFLDYNTAAGYMEYMPPHMVNAASAYGTGQLPDKEGQMYHATEDDFYLIPTAEVPVTNIYRDEILKEADLPIKMTAYTPCFRREAGSYGKDVRGLNRLHQFDKVEIVQLAHPSKSYEALEEMVEHVEKLIQSLGLPYRILRLCGGDMSFTSALTYDFEVYSAAQDKWLEVSSVSNFEAFQANRMKIRFKDEKGKPQLVHSLNGSSLALPRILACLLENNQTENGILLPPSLQPYFGGEMI